MSDIPKLLPAVHVNATAPNVPSISDVQGLGNQPTSLGDVDLQSLIDELPGGTNGIMSLLKNLGLGSNFIPALLQLFGNFYRDRKQYERQLEYMDKSHRQAIERWMLENDYNTPNNVKNRLIAAGLNPNLMYGQTGAGGTAGSVGSPSSPEAYSSNPFDGVSSIIMAMQQAQLTQSQIELNKANAEQSRANAGKADADVDIAYKGLTLDEQRVATLIERSYYENMRDYTQSDVNKQQVAYMAQGIVKMSYEMAELSSRQLENYYHAYLYSEQGRTHAREAQARIARDLSEVGVNHQQALYISEQCADIVATRAARIAQIEASTTESKERANLIQGQFQAMQDDILKSQMWYHAHQASPSSAAVEMTIDKLMNWVGSIFSVGVGFGSYKHTSLFDNPAPHNPIGFR